MFYDKDYPIQTIGKVIDKNIIRVGEIFSMEDTIEYLDISSIDSLSQTVTVTTSYAVSNAPSRAQYVLQKDDILYSTVRPNLQHIAVNPYCTDNVIGSTGFCVLRCKEVACGFMWGVITSNLFTEKMVSLAKGSNYPAVTDKIVHAYEFPMPPLEEQLKFEDIVKQSDKSKSVLVNAHHYLFSVASQMCLNSFVTDYSLG